MNEYKKRAIALRTESLRAYEAGEPIGDVGILKFAALAQPVPKRMSEALSHLRGYAPIYDPGEFCSLPEGTFGREYLQFLNANGIQHMTYSPEMLERFHDEPYAVRVAMTHDITPLLIAHRLEEMFELPLEEVRVLVGLPRDPRVAGIRYTDEIDGKPRPLANDSAVNRPQRKQPPEDLSEAL